MAANVHRTLQNENKLIFNKCSTDIIALITGYVGVRDDAVGWSTALETGSIPDGVIGIFHWHKPSDRTMALGSTQPLTEMSTSSISWRLKVAGA